MKVKELKEILSKFNDEDEIVITKMDGELDCEFEVSETIDYFFKGKEYVKDKCIVMW